MKCHCALVALIFLWAVGDLHAAVAWHHPLYLAQQGYWPLRVAVILHNDSLEAMRGEPVTVSIPALAGTRSESLRVCREDGVELLYDLRDARGRAKRSGTLAADDTLLWPAEGDAKSTIRAWVYAGNEQAWPVPDFLLGGFLNGGFESGDDYPDGWMPVMYDDSHRLTWEKAGGRSGSRCAQADVAAGSPATWVQWQQSEIPVVPGRTYEFSGWVRAENVVGVAGWYVHVNGEQPQLINKTLDAGQGTFDWKRISTRFTAPTNARTATLGTVLHGSGRAWFDDAEFGAVGVPAARRISVGPVERLQLKANAVAKLKPGPDFLNRAEVIVRNFSDQSASAALVRVNLRSALARLPDVPHHTAARVLSGEGAEVPAYRLGFGGDLLVASELPPRSERRFHVGFRSRARWGPGAALLDYERLLDSPVNRAANGNFERGAVSPDHFIPPATGGRGRVTVGFSTDAKFGRRSLELTVPADAKPDWVGWNSRPIPVKPGATYLLSGWLKGKGLRASATIHAHFHDAQGALCKAGAMASTSPGVSGDSDWTNTQGFLTAPPDAATIRLHLTMNTSGILRHDGVVLCEVVEGQVERVLSTTGSGPSRNEPFHVWEVNPLVKVFPDTPPQKQAGGVTVDLARNESESFQLALRGRFGAALGRTRVSVSPLKHTTGATLPPVKAERVGFVRIDYPSGYYTSDVPDWCRKVPRGSSMTDGWSGEWPDPLVPSSECDLATNQTQPVWFTVQAPRDAAPGAYHGEIKIQAGIGPATALPLTVNVLPFALPEKTRLHAIFDFRRGPGGWYGPDTNLPAEREKWLRFIAGHRLGIDGIEPAPKFTYREGRVTMDAREFDATATLCFDELGMNACYTPWFFYMFGWAYPPKKFFGLEPFTPEWTSAFKQAYQLFTDHLREKGWHDKFVYYLSDEPHFNHEFVVEQMKKLCALIHDVDPKLPIYSSTWRPCAAWDDSLDLWGVGQYGCFPVAEMTRLQKAGKKMWFTCDGQMATDTPYLATERLLPYYCFKYGVEGFEFWGLSWWTYDPWQRGWHTFIRQSDDGKKHYWIRYPNGDGYLAYPGRTVGVEGPVSTIRLEQVREGLEDFEAITMLAELAEKARKAGRPVPAAERALSQAKEIVSIPNAGGVRSTEILPEPHRLPAIRRAVNAALVELVR